MAVQTYQFDTAEGVIYKCYVIFAEAATVHTDALRVRVPVPISGTLVPNPPNLHPESHSVAPRQSMNGATISAKEFLARLRRDFTVPRLQPVISAISSYDFPSSSRRTNTSR